MFYYFINNGRTIYTYERVIKEMKKGSESGRRILIEADSDKEAWEMYSKKAYNFLVKTIFSKEIIFVRGRKCDDELMYYRIIASFKGKYCSYSLVFKDRESNKMNRLLLKKYGSENIIKDYDEENDDYRYYNKLAISCIKDDTTDHQNNLRFIPKGDFYDSSIRICLTDTKFVYQRQFNSNIYSSFDLTIPIRDSILFDIESLRQLFLKSQIKRRKEIIKEYNNIISSYDKLEEFLRKLPDEERLLLELEE